MNQNNIILATDSYKLNHWNQYPKNTEAVYSYFESRHGAQFPYTVFFGLQAILKQYLEGAVVTIGDVQAARELARAHFGNEALFNRDGWVHIVRDHGGKLPLRIKAVPEGTPVPTGNVLMTVENTCPECFWLTNAVESLLTHVWYPSTVATLSRTVKQTIDRYLYRTAESKDGLQFMLHDFGYRGASSHETAAIGGLAHLVNFVGTDTLPAMLLGIEAYGAELESLAFSVPATEHSVMTALGQDGEMDVVDQLLDEYPTGILSVVADSYNIYDFVDQVGTRFKDRILARDGVFVIRPDSITAQDPTPAREMVTLMRRLQGYFPSQQNAKGFDVIDPHVRLLWGDGIDAHGIAAILDAVANAGYSAENIATFGMGGGLLQKVNRDTQRFAFKSSAQKRDGQWHDIFKEPLDKTKVSKRGRLQLHKTIDGRYMTVGNSAAAADQLVTVFENGELVTEYTFDQIRENAALTNAIEVVV
jgi:nicotinamide phosphoribosyltransferase